MQDNEPTPDQAATRVEGALATAAQIARMPDEEYNAFRATPEGKQAIKRAMGWR